MLIKDTGFHFTALQQVGSAGLRISYYGTNFETSFSHASQFTNLMNGALILFRCYVELCEQ